MIVGSVQETAGVVIASVGDDGQIVCERFPTKFSNYQKCDPEDPERSNMTNFMGGEPLKRVPSKYFNNNNLREFMTVTLPQDVRDRIHKYITPNYYSVDIEIDMTEADGFPEASEAKWPIESISITASDLSTVVLSTSKDRINPGDNIIIEGYINDYFKGNPVAEALIKKHTKENRIKYNHMFFDSEKDLMVAYLKLVKQLLHSVMGWNWTEFDSQYIQNRCKKLNIDMGIASPMGKVDSYTGTPLFRIETDYMAVVKKFATNFPHKSYSLAYVSKYLLGTSKVEYEGSFINLFMGDYRKFLFYNAVDTILVQMIHLKYNIASNLVLMAFYSKIPLARANAVTSVAEALWFDELYGDGVFNANYDFIPEKSGKFEGGYVLEPRREVAEWLAIGDFKGLYPSSMLTLNCSCEAIVGTINLNDAAALKEAKAAGYAISMNGTLYRNEHDNYLKRIMARLMDERSYFKKLMFKVEQEITPPIYEEMKRRGLLNTIAA